MAKPFRMETEGGPALARALQQYPTKYVNKAVKPIMKEAMKSIVLPRAQRDTPVKTGMLRRSLKVRTAKGQGNKRLARGLVGFAVQSVRTKTIDAFYSGWVFLGATNRDGTRRRGTRTLRKALYDNSQQIMRYNVTRFRAALPKIAAEVRRSSGAKR